MAKRDRPGDVVDLAQVTNHRGILVSNALSGATVWDELGTAAPLDAVISARNEADEREKSAAQIARIATLVNESTVLLDVGCGYGRVAKYLLPETVLRAYVGVDGSAVMLRKFKQRYDASHEERRTPVLLVNSDIARMPLKPCSIDVAIMSAVFLHNHKSVVRAAMEEIERVLKPGGRLVIFSSFPRRATAMGAQGAVYQGFLNLIGDPMRNGPVRYYAKREVKQLMRNFSQVTIIPTGFEVLPKSIIGLKGLPERIMRNGLFMPLNALLERIVPRSIRPAFARHYDVIARK